MKIENNCQKKNILKKMKRKIKKKLQKFQKYLKFQKKRKCQDNERKKILSAILIKKFKNK